MAQSVEAESTDCASTKRIPETFGPLAVMHRTTVRFWQGLVKSDTLLNMQLYEQRPKFPKAQVATILPIASLNLLQSLTVDLGGCISDDVEYTHTLHITCNVLYLRQLRQQAGRCIAFDMRER